MRDQIPPPTPPSPSGAAQHQLRSLDDTIEQCIGHFGWTQFLQSTILSFAWFFDAQQAFITIFTDAHPKWSCNKNSTSLSDHFNHCNATSDICHLPKDSWSWDFSVTSSVVSEFSVHCSGPIIGGLPASAFYLGCMIGGLLLATLADSSFGRKKTMVLSCLIMSLSGVVTGVLSTNIWIYAGLRFITGIGRSTVGTCALVHASELVGKKWRDRVGMMGFLWFALGFLSLPLIAFLVRGHSWRLIYLCTSCPCVFYSLLVYFSVNESPRWLFVQGRKQELDQTLRKLASSSLEITFSDIEWREKPNQEQYNIYSALKILVKKRWALRRLATMMVVSFGVGMAYFGMPLGLGNLSFNLYLSVTMNALTDFLASSIMFFVVGRMRRKHSLVVLALLAGIAGAAASASRRWFNKGVEVGMELVSFFCVCISINVVMIYSLELFPTCIRNSAVSIVREASLLGAAVGPMLVALSGKNGLVLSYGVFGATIAFCGLFVVWLPETRGRVLYDTMEDEERKDVEI